MIRSYLLPLLALIGLAIGIATVIHDNRPARVAPPATAPARAPFASQVAGAGIIEHLHIHIVPRWFGDTNFMPVLAGTTVVPQALHELAARLRHALLETP